MLRIKQARTQSPEKGGSLCMDLYVVAQHSRRTYIHGHVHALQKGGFVRTQRTSPAYVLAPSNGGTVYSGHVPDNALFFFFLLLCYYYYCYYYYYYYVIIIIIMLLLLLLLLSFQLNHSSTPVEERKH